MTAQLHERPPKASTAPGVPVEFDRVIARALAKEPTERYPSAGDLARAALGAARGEPVTESERSVARGPAAPSEAPTMTQATRLAPPEEAKTRIATPPPPPPDFKVKRSRKGRGVLAIIVGVLALGVAGVALGAIVNSGSDEANGPLSDAEVRATVDGFARAYGSESVTGLRNVLAPNVRRVVPGDSQIGRPAVVAEYRRQFAGSDVRGYSLHDLEVRGGDAGRATGSYEVARAGRPPITGDIVFGVVRQHGKPRIALIAAEPTS